MVSWMQNHVGICWQVEYVCFIWMLVLTGRFEPKHYSKNSSGKFEAITPYSSGLAPSDFHLSLYLKRHLVEQNSTKILKSKLKLKWGLDNRRKIFYNNGLQKLVPWLNAFTTASIMLKNKVYSCKQFVINILLNKFFLNAYEALCLYFSKITQKYKGFLLLYGYIYFYRS